MDARFDVEYFEKFIFRRIIIPLTLFLPFGLHLNDCVFLLMII